MKTLLAHLITSIALLASAVVYTGCESADGASDEVAEGPIHTPATNAVHVQTRVIEARDFTDYIQLTGTVDANRDVTISAEAGGRVQYLAPLGTRLGQGSVVARFDDRVLKSALEAAQAQYDLAEATYRRQEALYRDSIISSLEYDGVRAQRDQTKAVYEQAQKGYEDTRLRSTVAGTVEQHYVEAGELVAPGTPVARVVDTRRVQVKAGVPERYALDVRTGTPVTIRFASIGGAERNAEITFTGSVIDAKSRTFPVEIDLDNSEGQLKPEMVVDVSIQRRVIPGAIVVPQPAIVRDENGTAVFVVDHSGDVSKAVRVAVVPGPGSGSESIIFEGLAAGQEVVTVGQSNLADGTLVNVVSPDDRTKVRQ
jgi:membrane fusion protein (multidrug efflux system)